MNTPELTWEHCCQSVILAAEGKTGGIAYAASYAHAGLFLTHAHEQAVQALYILNNIQYWRGGDSKAIRAQLKIFSQPARI